MPKNNLHNSYFTFIDLFAGIGGIRLPFQELGGKCVFFSEIDKHAQKTYFANYGEYPSGDITQISAGDIPNHDILLAGFPCQAFSQAGLKKRAGLFNAFWQKKDQKCFFSRMGQKANPRPILYCFCLLKTVLLVLCIMTAYSINSKER